MPPKAKTPDIFDQWASAAPAADVNESAAADEGAALVTAPLATPVELRRAVQELLSNGVLAQPA
ncbi:MAG: hypothetical protein KA216_08685, partial [Giesbergeria sp.]|nr:hypothetical protein [Giesbergeria sp.]